MPQPDHNAGLQAFYQWERDSFINVVSDLITGETRCFMPVESLKAYFQKQGGKKLDKILSLVFRPDEALVESEAILERYTAVFCILLHIGKARYIEHFACYDDLSDQRLPLDPASRPANFPVATDEPHFFERFCETQWNYCVPIFQRSMLNRHFEPHRLLPIIYREKVASGGSAILYKIRLHGRYNKLLSDEFRSQINDSTANTFALKRYLSQDAEDHYTQEVNCFKRLGANASIIGFYGSYIHGTSFNILLEFADKGTLEEYFQKESQPTTGEDIAKFWKGLFNIIKALEALHAIRSSTEGSQIFQGLHQDVKPANILVVSHGVLSQFDWQFKLADFGLSHFTMRKSPEEEATATDSQGTRTYGAPECYRSDDMAMGTINVKQGIDIWSLGCIYSEAAIWIADGYKGLLEYRRRRKAATDELPCFTGGDCFHDGHKVLDVVVNAHANIEGRLRKSDFITKYVLDTMVEEMLWTEERPRARALRLRAEKVLQMERRECLGSTRNEDAHMGRDGQTLPDVYQRIPPPVLPNGLPPWLSPRPYPTNETLPMHENQDNPYGLILSRGQRERLSVPGSDRERSSWQQHTLLPPSHIPRTAQPKLMSYQLPEGQSQHWQGRRSSEQQIHSEDFRGRLYLDSTDSLDDRRSVLENSDPNPYFSRDSLAVSPQELENRKNSVISNSPCTGRRSQPASTSPSVSLSALSTHAEHPSPGSGPGGLLTPPTSPSQRSPTSESTIQASSRVHQGQDHDNPPVVVSSTQDTQPHPPSLPPTHQFSNNPAKPARADLNEKPPQIESLSITEALEWKKISKGIRKKQSRMALLPGAHLLDVLEHRDHMFIIDDGAAMTPHWADVKTTFEALSYLVKGMSPDGITLNFTIDCTTRRCKDTTDLIKILKDKKLEKGQTDISRRLKIDLECYRLGYHQILAQKSAKSKGSTDKRPVSMYILTSGDWNLEPGHDPIGPIKEHIDWLIECKLKPEQYGIQFISFGKDPKCQQRLSDLVSKSNLRWDIIDWTPCTGNVWEMLLGAIDKTRFPSTRRTSNASSSSTLAIR